MQIVPHIAFAGDSAQAMELYQEAFGVKPLAGNISAGADVSSQLASGDLTLRLSDNAPESASPSERVALAVTFHYSDDAQHAYDTLARQGGRIKVALGESTPKHLYGQVTDRYGVTWHIILE